MDLSYDREQTAKAYDAYGEQEWDRHEKAPMHRVSFHVHRHYLTEFIHRGDRVLEAGAASGRFTVELARLGARIVVTDISAGQLELNVANVGEAGLESAVEARELADIVDLNGYPDGSFDAVVCYGGPLSHVMDRADEALGELLRVTKPGGHVLLGVMSRHGALHAFLTGADAEIEEFGLDEMQAIYETGDLPTDALEPGYARAPVQLGGAPFPPGAPRVRRRRGVGRELPVRRQRRGLRALAAGPRDVGAIPAMGGRQLRAAGSDRRGNAHHRRRPAALTSR